MDFYLKAIYLFQAKVASNLQLQDFLFCIGFLIVGTRFPETPLYQVGVILLWVVVVLAILSMIQYFRRFWGQIDESFKSRERQALR